MVKLIRFTAYARGKFIFLREHGFGLHEEDVKRTILEPDRVSRVRIGR